MQSNCAVYGENSALYQGLIPKSQLPESSGNNRILITIEEMPLANGSNKPNAGGIFYSSIVRDKIMTNFSNNLQDLLTAQILQSELLRGDSAQLSEALYEVG